MKKTIKNFLVWFVTLFCIILLLHLCFWRSMKAMEINKERSSQEQTEIVDITPSPIVSIPIEAEYDMKLLPDGLYIYQVDGTYMIVGIQTTGRESSTGNRAGHVTFYASSDNGEVISTYDTVFIETESCSEFWCVEDKYHLLFTEYGTLKVKQLVEFDELGTDISFEGEYMFLYSFDESNTHGKGDGQCAI